MGLFTRRKKSDQTGAEAARAEAASAAMAAELKAQQDVYALKTLADALFCGELADGAVAIKETNIRIRVEVEEACTGGVAVLHFIASSPDWDREIFEVQVATDNTPEAAISKAILLFQMGLMQTICRIPKIKTASDEAVIVDFADTAHRFDTLIGPIVSVGAGAPAEQTNERVYYDLIKDELVKRLGGQKINYCKIFCARNGENITIEVRLNNYVIPALGALLRPLVETWPADKFGSQKQFIIFRQDDATWQPYPYRQTEFQRFVRVAAELFTMFIHDDGSLNRDERFLGALMEKIGDRNLAYELYRFIPEICAMNAFPEINLDDETTVCTDGSSTQVFLTQYASYVPIWEGVQAEYGHSIAGETYTGLVTHSSIINVLDQVLKAHPEFESLDRVRGVTVRLMFNFPADYKLQ